MIQTWALLIDAYRELSAKKLFWITLILSGLVVAVFGMFGINEKGLTVLWWEFPLPLFNSTTIPPATFYKFVFANFGVPIWLAWVAGVLALISTASIIPDFIAGGAVELTLSKPIGRLRLFLTKYFTGLLFVTMQVGLFTGACFLVIGLRGQTWVWGIWLAVPIVLLMFSYLFSICALVGLLTRSTIAALLLTLLAWFAIWLVNTADAVMILQRESAIMTLESRQKAVVKREESVRKLIEKGTEVPEEGAPAANLDEAVANHPLVVFAREQVKQSEESVETWSMWAGIIFQAKTVLPKTSETIGLLDRHLLSQEDLKLFQDQRSEPVEEDLDAPPRRRGRNMERGAERAEAVIRARSVWWVAGTSVVFEVVMLSIACIVFVRRDF